MTQPAALPVLPVRRQPCLLRSPCMIPCLGVRCTHTQPCFLGTAAPLEQRRCLRASTPLDLPWVHLPSLLPPSCPLQPRSQAHFSASSNNFGDVAAKEEVWEVVAQARAVRRPARLERARQRSLPHARRRRRWEAGEAGPTAAARGAVGVQRSRCARAEPAPRPGMPAPESAGGPLQGPAPCSALPVPIPLLPSLSPACSWPAWLPAWRYCRRWKLPGSQRP